MGASSMNYEEMCIQCSHAIAALRAVGENAADPIWFKKGLSVETYICEYAAEPVSLGFIKLLRSTVVEMQPPHRIVKSGRPKQKKTTEQKRQCVGCGGKGHFLSTCTKIDVGRGCERRKSRRLYRTSVNNGLAR